MNAFAYREIIDRGSAALFAAGLRLLQGHRLGASDYRHTMSLLDRMAPEQGEQILDVGCGFGEPARLMAAARPDLRFTLLNVSAVQLRYAPKAMPRVGADAHKLPFPAASFDRVMFLYSLCHMRPLQAFMEAARVTRPGGGLFIYDYERLRGDNGLMRQQLMAEAHPWWTLDSWLRGADWEVVGHEAPEGDDYLFRALFALEGNPHYDRIFGELRPMIVQARRRDLS